MPTSAAPARTRYARTAAVAIVALLAAGACSTSGGAGRSDGPTTTASGGSTSTTAAGGLDPTEFDPCALVKPADLAELVDDAEPVLARGIELGAPTPIDECRLDSVGPGIVSVGVAAANPVRIEDLLPPAPPTGAKKARQLADLGDDAFVQEISGAYYVVVDAGNQRLLRVRAEIFGLADKSPEPVITLARQAVERLPERLPDGGSALPPVCDDLDLDLVQPVIGKVVLARGSEVEDGFTCDLVGDEGDKVFVTAYRTSTPIIDGLLEDRAQWRPIDGGEKGAVSASAQYFVATAAPGIEVVVDTGAHDAPLDGAQKGGYPVQADRRALFLAGIELARTLG